MNKIFSFCKKELVLMISLILALLSMLIIPPSQDYLSYINYSVLALLFCLMAVVAGFQQCGVFSYISQRLLKKNHSLRSLSLILIMLCFFSSMLITNDVALLTFVPLSISILSNQKPTTIIFVIVMQTIAANLGSLVTPIGNPQNLFIFDNYNLSLKYFFSLTIPLGICCLFLILLILAFTKNEQIHVNNSETITINYRQVAKLSFLFILCLLTVVKIIDYKITLLIVFLVILFTDRKLLRKIDYCLLFTFICFFILVGNLAQIEPIKNFISHSINGHELLYSIIISQIISNVPAAIMLASFTDNVSALLLGVNIGGLGTIIASLASLISYKQYCQIPDAPKGKYLLIFTLFNFALLLILFFFALILL